MRLKVLSLYFPKDIEKYEEFISKSKTLPSVFPFRIAKQDIFSLQEYQDYKKQKDLGFEEVFLWFWNMSEAKRYPAKRLDFFKEIIIESLEQAKKEGEFLERRRSQKL